MSAFADIFDSTAAFLRSKGITPEVSKAKKSTHTAIEGFHKQTGISLPDNFSAFFTDFADGFEFRWERSEDEGGIILIPGLTRLSKQQETWQHNVRDFLRDPHSLDGCIDAPFRPKAFEIWRKMESWVPFLDEGDGDHFCVDTATGQIVYDQHDWFDGFGSLAKTNGILAGENLTDFLRSWSQFCFQPNKSLWWGEFAEFGAVKWEPEYFGAEFFRGHSRK
jgi:hypothetical protein